MDFRPLLKKLIEIEMSVGVEAPIITRNRVFDAQNCLLEMQAENVKSPQKEVGRTASQRFAMLRNVMRR